MTEQTETTTATEDVTADRGDENMDRGASPSSGGLSTSDLARGSATGGESGDVQRETVSQSSGKASETPLFDTKESGDFKSQWQTIQAAFVDDPRRAVKEADSLVVQTMKRLAEIFADEREKLEAQWGSGEDVDTEALRVALQRYRSFFDRLLSV
jgi:hypothetical protein